MSMACPGTGGICSSVCPPHLATIFIWGRVSYLHRPQTTQGDVGGEIRNTKVQRWAMLMAEYGAPIEYVKGIQNIKADFLSRMKVADIGAHQMCDISLGPPGHTYYAGRLSADGIDPALFREAQDRAFPTVLEDDSEFTLFENFICTVGMLLIMPLY